MSEAKKLSAPVDWGAIVEVREQEMTVPLRLYFNHPDSVAVDVRDEKGNVGIGFIPEHCLVVFQEKPLNNGGLRV